MPLLRVHLYTTKGAESVMLRKNIIPLALLLSGVMTLISAITSKGGTMEAVGIVLSVLDFGLATILYTVDSKKM